MWWGMMSAVLIGVVALAYYEAVASRKRDE